MAKIRLSSGFTTIPEGEHIFTITKAEYKEKFGTIELEMVTENGINHKERYVIADTKGNQNDKALAAFSILARAATNDYDPDSEIDPVELKDCKFVATVVHDVRDHRDDPNKTVTFVQLTDKRPYDGEEIETPAPKPTPVANKPATKTSSLAAFLAKKNK